MNGDVGMRDGDKALMGMGCVSVCVLGCMDGWMDAALTRTVKFYVRWDGRGMRITAREKE